MNYRKKTATVIVAAVVPLLLTLTIVFAALQPKKEPTNPLLEAVASDTKPFDEEQQQQKDNTKEDDNKEQKKPILQETNENSTNKTPSKDQEQAIESTEELPSQSSQETTVKPPPDIIDEIIPQPDDESIVYFTTDITDGKTLNERAFSFTVTHIKNDLMVKSESVYVNGSLQPIFGKALLDEGSNTLKIIITYTDHSGKVITAFCDYTLFVDLGSFNIFTTLENKTVNEPSVAFTAYISNKETDARLTVVCNGKTLSESQNSTYIAPLNTGINSLRIKATCTKDGEKLTINKTFTVTYVPLADTKTAPKIEYINITDNMKIKGSSFTLDLLAKDYLGNRIYHNAISIALNGKAYSYVWASEFTTYLLYFENGKNVLDIRITDGEGRFSDYSYTIYCKEAQDGEKLGTFTLEIDAKVLNLGYILPPVKLNFYQGEAISKTITRFLDENGFKYKFAGSISDGFYLARLEKEGLAIGATIPAELQDFLEKDNLPLTGSFFEDSLGELDFCKGSGWHWALNGNYASYSMSNAVLHDGDKIKIRFSLAYGKDIGAYSTGNYEKVW